MATADVKQFEILRDPRYSLAQTHANGRVIIRNDPAGRQYVDDTKAAEMSRQFYTIIEPGWYVATIVAGAHGMLPLADLILNEDILTDVERAQVRTLGVTTEQQPTPLPEAMLVPARYIEIPVKGLAGETPMPTPPDNSSFALVLIASAKRNPAGAPTLAREVGCSVLTAKKHLDRAVAAGELVATKGPRGTVYGGEAKSTAAPVAPKTQPAKAPPSTDPWGRKGLKVTTAKGVCQVTAVNKDRTKIKVVIGDTETVGFWDPETSSYATKKGLTITK